MEEAQKLIEYSRLGGINLTTDGIILTVDDDSRLTYRLEKLLKLYKEEVIEILLKEQGLIA